jgi:hypothetical protein
MNTTDSRTRHPRCSATLHPTPEGTKFQGLIRLEDQVLVSVIVVISSDQRRARLKVSPALLVKTSVFKFHPPPDPVYATLLRTSDDSGIDFGGYISLGDWARRYEVGVTIRQRTDYTQTLDVWVRPLHLHAIPLLRLEVVKYD